MKSKLKKIILFFLVFLFCLYPFYRVSSIKKVKANAGALVLNGGLEVVNGLLSILGISLSLNLGSASGVKDYIGVQKCLKCEEEFVVDGSNAMIEYYEHCNNCNGDKNNLPNDKKDKKIPLGQELLLGKLLQDSLTDEQKQNIANSLVSGVDLNIIFTANQLNSFAKSVNNLLNYDYISSLNTVKNPKISEKITYINSDGDTRVTKYLNVLKENNYPYVFTCYKFNNEFYDYSLFTTPARDSLVNLFTDSKGWHISFYSLKHGFNNYFYLYNTIYPNRTGSDHSHFNIYGNYYSFTDTFVSVDNFFDSVFNKKTMITPSEDKFFWDSDFKDFNFFKANDSRYTDYVLLDVNAPNGFVDNSIVPDLDVEEEYVVAPSGLELPVNFTNSLEVTVPAEKVQEWSEVSYDPSKNNKVLPDSAIDSEGNPKLDEITENVKVEEKSDNDNNNNNSDEEIDTENNSLDFSPLKKVFEDKFPFCIPWDIKNLLEVFNAEEKPISFKFDDVYLEKFDITIPGFEVNFAEIPGIDVIVKITKFFSIMGFILFLVVITRKIIKG